MPEHPPRRRREGFLEHAIINKNRKEWKRDKSPYRRLEAQMLRGGWSGETKLPRGRNLDVAAFVGEANAWGVKEVTATQTAATLFRDGVVVYVKILLLTGWQGFHDKPKHQWSLSAVMIILFRIIYYCNYPILSWCFLWTTITSLCTIIWSTLIPK